MIAPVMFSKIDPQAVTPSRFTSEAAGFDLYGVETKHIKPFGRKLIPTGIEIMMHPGYYGQLAECSSITRNKGVIIGAGVIDSDYRGQLYALVINPTKRRVTFYAGDRICQLIIKPYYAGAAWTVDPKIWEGLQRHSDRCRQGLGVGDTDMFRNEHSVSSSSSDDEKSPLEEAPEASAPPLALLLPKGFRQS